MNRFEFLSQVKKDLVQTLKEIVSPVIEDDIDKINHMIEDISGIKWYEVPNLDTNHLLDVEEKMINNQSIYFYSDNHQATKAVDKICFDCHTMIHWLSHEKKFKCFQCEKDYSIEDGTGQLNLRFYKLKKRKEKWLVALK